MSSPDRFTDNRYKNWLKCGLALIEMKEGLHQHVNNQVQTLHNYLISKVSPLICGASATIHCGVCTWRDIKYDRHNKLWHMNCSKNICNVWLGEIIAVHKTPTNHKINWWNCDISQWPSDPYQVAKAFMPNGQANVTKLPEDLDPPAILSLLYYCSFLCKNVPNTQILHDLIEVRNSLFHSGNFYVEDLEKDTWVNNMLQLLQDLKLNGTKIEKIKREDLDISFREMEIKVFEALVSTLNSDLKTMYAALNIKINSLEDCQKEQEEKMGKLQVSCSDNTVKVVAMETKMESFEKFTQDFIPVKTFFDNNSDIPDHINNNTEIMSRLQDCFEILKTKLESTNAELTSIKSRVEGVEDLDRKVSGYGVDLEKIVSKLEMLSGIQSVVDKWNRNKIVEEKNMKSADQTLGDQEQRSFQQDRMPAAWTFTKEEIDRAWVPLEGVLEEELAPSYILSSLTFLSDNEHQAICKMETRGEMAKVLLCRVKEQLPDAFIILLNTLKEKGPEQLAEKLVKIIKGTCILDYVPKSNMSSLTMKLNVKEEDGTIVKESEKKITRSISRVSSVFSEDLQLMVTDVIVGSVIIHLQPLSEHAQAALAFFCKHGGIKDFVLNLLRKKDIYASLPIGEVYIEVEVCHREEDAVSEDASEPWRDFASESFEVVSTDHVIKENLRLQYRRLLDEIEPLHLKKTFTDKGILDKCFLELRDLERRRERAAYFLDKLLAIGSDEALVTLVDALKESGRENLATNLVAKITPYLNDTDDVDESFIQVVKVSQKHAEGSILWSCCLKVTVENNDGKEQGMRYSTEEGKEQGMRHPTEEEKEQAVAYPKEEKEPAMAYPQKGDMNQQVPEYYRTLSQRVSRILDVIGYSQEDQDRKVRCATTWEVFCNITKLSKSDIFFNKYIFGSRGDGSTGPGLQSDQDILYENDRLNIVTDLSDCQPYKLNLLMVEDDFTHPGYVKLQKVEMLPGNIPCPVFQPQNQSDRVDFYGRITIPNQFLHRLCSAPAISGPSIHTRHTVKELSSGVVIAIRCTRWPYKANEWLQRRRPHGWPKSHFIQNARKNGCFASAVGHLHSPERDLEWRLSFSFTERDLIRSFEDTAMKVYILLKMIKKTYIEPVLGDAFSSYQCKVCILWVREKTPTELWCTENLLYCLTLCIKQLYEWAAMGYCPDYFIITNNIYDRRIFGETQLVLTRVLKVLMSDDYRVLFGIKCCNLGQRLLHDCSRLDAIRSPGFINTDVMLETCVDYILCGQAASYYRLHMLRYIPQEYSILTSYIERIMHATQQAPHTLRVCFHHVLMMFLSQLGFYVVSVCKENAHFLSQEEVDYLMALASRCLSLGINSDATSVRLKLCGLGIMLGNYDLTEICLQHISDHKMRYMFSSKLYTTYTLRCNWDLNLDKFLTEGYDTEELLQNQTSFSVVYLMSEISIIPVALRMEMFRSIGTDFAIGDKMVHFWHDWAVVDSLMCLYLFQYLNYSRQGKAQHQQVALENMIHVIRTEPHITHRETELNLVGYCFMRESQLRNAYIYLYTSLKLCPHHNAAKFYLGILFRKAHVARRRE